jgi:hypothetical protein
MSTPSDLSPVVFVTNIGSADAAHYCSDGASDRRARDCAAHGTRRCSGGRSVSCQAAQPRSTVDDRDHCRCLRWVLEFMRFSSLSNDRVVARNDRAVEAAANYIRTPVPTAVGARRETA